MIDWDTLSPDDLDGDLAEIARLLGMPAARYFAEEWGGMRLYIRRTWTADDADDRADDLAEIARVLGSSAVEALTEARGGTWLYVPYLHAVRRRIIEPLVRKAYNGRNAGALARRYSVSRRQVLEIVQRPPEKNGD